jgi:hypothetical protein
MNGVINSIRTVTESSVAMQQELFKKWMGMWPGALMPPSPFEEPQTLQKKWMEVGGELLRKQNDWLMIQITNGLRTIEEAFRLVEAKDAEELRTKTIKLWQKSFDCLRQTSEGQIRGLHNAVAKWTELMKKGYRPATQPRPESGANEKKPVRGMSDGQELKEALMEYEMTKGDWSKGR